MTALEIEPTLIPPSPPPLLTPPPMVQRVKLDCESHVRFEASVNEGPPTFT